MTRRQLERAIVQLAVTYATAEDAVTGLAEAGRDYRAQVKELLLERKTLLEENESLRRQLKVKGRKR